MSPHDEDRPGPETEGEGSARRRPQACAYPETAGSLLARRIRSEERAAARRTPEPSGEPPQGEI